MSPLHYLEQLIRYGSADAKNLPKSERTWGLQHLVGRLATSLQTTNFGLDQAILLRQCIRHLLPGQRIIVERVAPNVLQHFSVVGLSFGIDGCVEAAPFTPSWLESPGPLGADVPALQQVVDDQPVPGEAWLKTYLGKSSWRSQAQMGRY